MAEGGDEYDFVNESPDPKYYCLVCRNVLREPMLADCCGQHYCKSCLQQCNRSSYTRRCPHCHRENYQSILDQSMQREINQLKIYCVNRSSKSCWWRDELSKLPRHLNTFCPQRENVESLEKCPSGCGKMIKTGEIEVHREKCPSGCGKMIKTGEIEVHREKCPSGCGKMIKTGEIEVHREKCPSGCGKMIKTGEIEVHREKCPLEEVTCMLQGPNENNEVVTCGQRLLHLELPIHEKICPFRIFECNFCKKASTYVSITGQTQTDIKQPKVPPERGHYAECPDYPLSCKNKCRSGEIRRADMEQHLRECPLEKIQCEHWEEGCQEMVRRKDMGGHLKAFKKQHQECVRFAYLHKKKDMKDLKAELGTTKDELAATKFELNAAKMIWPLREPSWLPRQTN